MFCRKCGTELPDDAQFCVSCGCPIEVSNEPKKEVQVRKDFNKRDAAVTHSSLDKFQIKGTSFNDRVESTDDKELNDKLFTLYDMLIIPVKYIEEKSMSASQHEATANDKSWFSTGLLRYFIKILIVFYVINIISGFACFATENKVLRAYTAYYNEFWGTSYEKDTDIPVYLPNGKSIYLDGAQYFMKSGKFYYAYVMKMEDVSNERGLTWMFFVGSLYNAIFIVVVLELLSLIIGNIIGYNGMKKRVATHSVLAKKDRDEAMQILDALSEHLKYVPVDCRNSIALEYFVKSYRNTLVSNLAEAVKEFTDYKRHEEVMESLESMRDQLGVISSKLDSISFAQDMMVSELANMNKLMGMQNLLIAVK